MFTFASSSRGRAAVARRAHNPKVLGSIPSLATKAVKIQVSLPLFLFGKVRDLGSVRKVGGFIILGINIGESEQEERNISNSPGR